MSKHYRVVINLEHEKLLKHYGILGMRWGVTKGESTSTKKSTTTGKKSVSKKSTTKASDLKKRYRRAGAKMDVFHVDAKTGNYSNNSKTAKTLRIVNRTLDLAQTVTIGAGSALLSQSHNDEKLLKHYGVLGMRWGVRRDRVTISERLGSLKRERNWKKVLKEVDQMDTEEIKMVTKRVQKENQLKTLVKTSKTARDSDRKDYIRRGDLTDDELSDKVSRLQAKDSLSKSVYDASKEQREFGERIVNSGSSIALSYATNQTLTGKDIYDAITSPDKKASDKLKDNLRERAIDELMKSLK